LRANRAAGAKRMTVKRMRFSPALRVRCESSQIVNSHYEQAKATFIWEDVGALALRGFFKNRQIRPGEGLIVENGLTNAALPVFSVSVYANKFAA
jgi:hypothetical protein